MQNSYLQSTTPENLLIVFLVRTDSNFLLEGDRDHGEGSDEGEAGGSEEARGEEARGEEAGSEEEVRSSAETRRQAPSRAAGQRLRNTAEPCRFCCFHEAGGCAKRSPVSNVFGEPRPSA